MSGFDPRITPARPELAAEHLRDRVQAARYVKGVARRVIDPVVPLRRTPRPDAPLDTELLYGEPFTVYDSDENGWAWGQAGLDDYVGWIPLNALGAADAPATHRVAALRTFAFAEPDAKAPTRMTLSFGSRLAIAGEAGSFMRLRSGEFVPSRHVVAVDAREPDPVAVARRFLGTPYLWGGRSSLGLDCSGLVQLALQAAGHACPRDSDMQARIGTPIETGGNLDRLQPGDLVCWPGHVGIIAERDRLVHANGFHMAVAEEPLSEALGRMRRGGIEISGVRRL